MGAARPALAGRPRRCYIETMHPPPPQGRTAVPSKRPSHWPADVATHEPRNLALLAAHQIVFRVGWIFKTESVIIPAFLDSIAGPSSGMLRGLLPVMSRFGQSVPPAFVAGWLRSRQLKKRALAGFTMAMSLPFAALAATCFAVGVCRWRGVVWWFLALYGLFFVFNGLYHLAFGTVQGKLVRPWRRGRLLLISTFYGALPAMLMAWWLLPGWLDKPEVGFGWIFAVAASCFMLSGLIAFLLFEPCDETDPNSYHTERANVAEMVSVFRQDRNLRRLTVVAMLFGCGLIVVPHYQALALGPMHLPMATLMLFAITQNASVGVFSLVLGPLADHWGNRAALGLVVLGSAMPPAMAALFAQLPAGMAEGLYWMIYIPLGVTPLALRILVNYTLEICLPHQHPRYLATVNLCLAIPFAFAPLAGLLIDVQAAGFRLVFIATAVLVALGALMTLTLEEPRSRWIDGELSALGAGVDE